MNWQLIGNIAGQSGRDGQDGKSVTIADVHEVIEATVTKAVAAIARPADGHDGVGITGAFIDRQGHLVLTLSDGSTKDVGGVVGKDGAEGKAVDMEDVRRQIAKAIDAIPKPKDGLDGMGFDDFDLILDETRGWLLRLVQGDRVKEILIPIPWFKGNWEAGTTYPKGAGVRWDGHFWWALKETAEQPGEGSSAWQIVVSRGKQGREGKQGKDGAPGRDLTQINPATGQKW